MLRGTLGVVLSCLSPIVEAQEWTTYFGGSVGVSGMYFEVVRSRNSTHNLGYSVQFTEEAVVSKALAVTLGLGFRSLNGEGSRRIPVVSVPEVSWHYRHHLIVRSIEMPLLIELRTSPSPYKGIHLSGGVSLSYALESSRQIDTVLARYGSKEVFPMIRDEVVLRTGNGSRFGICAVTRLGKRFLVAERSMICALEYPWDISTWKYPLFTEPMEVGMKRKCLLLVVQMEL